ncbi:MAG: hypothetical protein ACJ74W_22040 [Pyrinomonadaceae bacterium]
MPRVVLLPHREDPPNWPTEVISRVFNKDDELPNYWMPELGAAQRIEDVDAFAFPTPFAWAEMMAAVIRQRDFEHLMFRLYSILVRGLVLGHLQLDIVDLNGPAGGNFGKVLASTDDNYRYFGLLRSNPQNRELPPGMFGATSPESLFWPSPRRTAADWQTLAAAIDRDPRLNDAYQVLADFRALLERANHWNASSAVAPWMGGLNHIIESHRLNIRPSAGHKHFHVHSRLVGPINARFADGKERPLYFPVYEAKYAANFLRALTGSFAREKDHVAVYDGARRKSYEIRTPEVGAGGNTVLAGGGTVRVLAEPSEQLGSQQIRVHDLFALVQDVRRAMGDDVADIKKHPFLYPDVFRVTVSRLGEAGLDDEVSFSDQAYKLTFDPDSPGLPFAAELHDMTEETRGIVLPYKDEKGQPRKAIYVDSYAGTNVGDLKALGWVLWSYFIGEAEVNGGKLKVEDKDGDFTAAFKEGNSNRPFDLRHDIYEKVYKERDRHRRLATLQRFLKAYAAHVGAPDESGVNTLCHEAALSFVRWVWPDSTLLEDGNGHPPHSSQVVSVGNYQARLERDE